MKPFPAIAFFEISDIATGLPLADKMLKAAPVALLRSGIVSGGKYLILLAGTVGAVETAYLTAKAENPPAFSDALFLPDVDPSVYKALSGEQQVADAESLVTLQSSSIAETIELSDRIVKGSSVRLLHLHIGDGYAGNGFAIFNGTLHNAEIAAEIGNSQIGENINKQNISIIPQINVALIKQLTTSLKFSEAQEISPEGGELPDALG